LLDKMLAAIGMGRDEAYITNVVYWRPPGNRTPTPQEVQACQPFLQRQIELVEPEILLLLGGAAAKQVLDTEQGIMKLRGKWKTYELGGRSIRTMATLHPAFLLRNPVSKRMAWRDLLMVKAALGGETDKSG
jgi:DNA polymerase